MRLTMKLAISLRKRNTTFVCLGVGLLCRVGNFRRVPVVNWKELEGSPIEA